MKRITESPAWNFCFGIIGGALIGFIITLHIVTGQVQDHTKTCVAAIHTVTDQCKTTVEKVQNDWREVSDLWEQRAEKCEVKERMATVIYEYRPGMSVPVMHGVFAITLGSEGNHPDSDMKPVWFIPVQTPVYSTLPGASYEWLDGKTGRSIGRFPATPPPTTEAPQ